MYQVFSLQAGLQNDIDASNRDYITGNFNGGQLGSSNIAGLTQYGDNNYIALSQSGNDSAFVVQVGHLNEAIVNQ